VTSPGNSEQRLLAALEADSNGEQIIRWTRQRAQCLNASWVVLCVETLHQLSQSEQAQLTRNLELARELGAEVVTTTGDDVVASTLRVARQRNVSEIVVAKSVTHSWWKRLEQDLALRRLIRRGGEVVLHIVPASGKNTAPAASPGRRRPLSESVFPQYLLAVAAVAAMTVAAFVFTPVVGAHATALVFLLTVVLLAVVVERGPALVAAALSALSWDYFFLPPVFAFRLIHFEDVMLLGMYFVVALVLGQLTARIRAQEEAERDREERATALYLLTRELSQATSLDHLVQIIVHQVESVFGAQVVILIPDSLEALKVHRASTLQLTSLDQTRLASTLEQRQGPTLTEHFQIEDLLYMPVDSSRHPVALFGLRLRAPLSIHQRNLLEAFMQPIALALERHRLTEISDRAKLLAESERLSKSLLDSVSHEIRTPIAAIKSATENLAELPAPCSSFQREMIGEIKQATERLNRLVGNVLEVSRLESGHVRPRFNECDVSELVHVAVAETEQELASHKLTVDLPADLPLVRMDFVLMQQVLTNLLSNVATHTPAGTAVELSASVRGDKLVLEVADTGPGIPSESLTRVFNKFYRAPNAPTGGSGLGLSMVKGFVEAHGGQVSVENLQGSGALFTVSLPLALTKLPPQARHE
jgi:two-component system sensor histidine kinase KdpD